MRQPQSNHLRLSVAPPRVRTFLARSLHLAIGPDLESQEGWSLPQATSRHSPKVATLSTSHSMNQSSYLWYLFLRALLNAYLSGGPSPPIGSRFRPDRVNPVQRAANLAITRQWDLPPNQYSSGGAEGYRYIGILNFLLNYRHLCSQVSRIYRALISSEKKPLRFR